MAGGAYRIAVRVLIAPDKFRGTLAADEAARAIGAGWRRERPEDVLAELPVADGGEGTLQVIAEALGGHLEERSVTGPLGDPIRAAFGLVDRSGGTTGLVELASASGLNLVGERREPMRASTRGTGELILAACRAGAREVIVFLGGSASTDGGAGIAMAVGARLLREDGRSIPDGGEGLRELATIDISSVDPAVRAARIVAACDVASPLLRIGGAARVYAPQKGASAEQVLVLERALGHLAAVIQRDLAIDLRDTIGAGAAGGAAAGLVAFLGAHLRRGTDLVFEAVAFEEALASSDLLVTGEGRFDTSSLAGKVVGAAIERARRFGVPALVLCGEAGTIEPGVLGTGVEVRSLVDLVGAERARTGASTALAELASRAAAARSHLSSAP